MEEKVTTLNSHEISNLKQEFEILTFPNDFDLIYENHVPSTGIALIEGQIDLIKKSCIHRIIMPPQLIGVRHLLSQRPVKFSYRVRAHSQLILMGKSQLLKYLNDKHSTLFSLLREETKWNALRDVRVL